MGDIQSIEESQKAQAEKAYYATATTGSGIRQATVTESYAQQQKAHQDQADRHAKAVAFLNAHPEFSEFIALFREGIFA